MSEQELSEKSLQLIRHQLGSVDLSDFTRDEKLTEEEHKNYDAQISAVFHHLEKDIRRVQYLQLEFTGLNAQSFAQVIMGRGTVNGGDLLLNLWKGADLRHMSRKPEGTPDQSTPIGEFEEQ